MTTLEEAQEREHTQTIEAPYGVHFESPSTKSSAVSNYQVTTRGGRTLAHAQTLNLNGQHPASFPPGTEIGADPGVKVVLVVDREMNGENGGNHVWVYTNVAHDGPSII